MLAWLSRRAHAVHLEGGSMPKYAAEAWNKFLAKGNVLAKYQTREQVMEHVHTGPDALTKQLPAWKAVMERRFRES
jgi:hypothetical protein